VPHGITLWGRLYDEGTILNMGMALEAEFGVWDRRPPIGA
jgi:Asp-tRNA(Asn)/Glu-tRNA(Gln) amidotransferase A subunit family amidase